jgi:hypothetical protein
MGLSHRQFLIDKDDRLYRLASTKFMSMLQNPASYRLQQFAGQRVRAASAVVMVVDRQLTQVVRITFDILTFDDTGHFDADIYGRHQFSRAELGMAPLISDYSCRTDVIDGSSQFIARGGRWTPSPAVARAIDDAALGRVKCPSL